MSMYANSHKLTRDVMLARAAHSEKLTRRDDDIDPYIKKLHEQAFNSYGHAERLLKMNGESAIFAANRHIKVAKTFEEKIEKLHKEKSKDLTKEKKPTTKYKNPLLVKTKKLKKEPGGDDGFGGVVY